MPQTDVVHKPTIMTEEEALQYERQFNSQLMVSAGIPKAELTVDPAQLLALGGITTSRVYGTASAIVDEQNDYGFGRVFDVRPTGTRVYGKHVDQLAGVIDLNTSVTTQLVKRIGGQAMRAQIVICSELQTDKAGRSFYQYGRRLLSVTGQPMDNNNGWEFFDKKKVQGRLKLYVGQSIDVEGKSLPTFYTLKNGNVVTVRLGDPATYDHVANLVKGSGILEQCRTALNEIPLETREELSEDKQLLFWSVFKTVKANIFPVL